MPKHKKQHYIPKCYLKAWCDPNCPPKQTPYIWMYEKESREGKRKAPDNIFHETDMYTVWDEYGGRNLVIEHGLAGLEDQFSMIRNKKFKRNQGLDRSEHLLICIFISAIHARTKSQLQHIADQWRRPLEMMDKMAEKMKTATEEEKRSMASISSLSSSSEKDGFTHDQVRKMVEYPARTMLVPMIQVEAPLLSKLDFAVFYTDTTPGFITSDRPCVWFDPKAHTRPPFYRGPALMYETIEITLPISPTQSIYLNRQGINGYQYLPESVVKELNRRVRFHASEYYVVNQDFVDDSWFDPGKEPEDSWEKQQAKKANKPIQPTPKSGASDG